MTIRHDSRKYDQAALFGLLMAINRAFGLTFEDLKSRNRSLNYTLARTMFVKLFRDTQQVKFEIIGKLLTRYHTTAQHLYRQHDSMYELNYKGYSMLFREVVDEYKGFLAKRKVEGVIYGNFDAGASSGEDFPVYRQAQ